MKNINLLGIGKKKTNSFLISKTSKQSLFFYFIQKWDFFEKSQMSFLEDQISYILGWKVYSRYSNEYILNNSINHKITSHIYLQKHLKKRHKPSTKVKMNLQL